MLQPVGDMLGGNAQGRAVFHQPDVVNIRYLGAAHALIDPAHDIAEDALDVVLQLPFDHILGEIGIACERDGQQFAQPRRCALRDFGLQIEHIDAVIMHRMERGGSRARHPGGVGAGLRMADLLFHHVGHAIGRGPHALADLRLARKAVHQTDLNVALLIGGDPLARFHVALGHDRAGRHAGVHLVTGTIEKAGVDEEDALLHRVDAGGQNWRRCGALRPSRRL